MSPRFATPPLLDIESMSQRRQWTMSAAIAAVTVAIVRFAVSHGRNEYAIWPDEPAQLAIARFVGGGTRWDMHNHSVWRPLYATLLSPVYWFTDDPATVFHTALALNAVLGGIAAALLVVLARRLTVLGPWWCAALAVAISLTPAMLFTTDFVFSESLLVPTYLATLIALLRFNDTPSLSDGLIAAVLAGAAFGTHSRMLPLTLIVVGVAAMAAIRRRMAIRDAVAIGVVAFATVYLMSVYSSYIVDRLWNEPSTRNSFSGVIDQLRNGPAVLVSLIGQSWSLLVSTIGFVAYGLFALVRSAIAPRADRSTAPTPGDARIVLVVFGACAALSVVFMSDRWRSDQLVYGRYNAAVVAPVLIVGVVALMGTLRIRRVVAMVGATMGVTAMAGVALWVLRRGELRESNGLEPMILGLQPFITSATQIDVPRVTAWSIMIMLGIGVIALAGQRNVRVQPILLLASVVVLVVAGSWRTRDTIDRLWDDSGGLRAVEDLRDGPLADGVSVDYVLPIGSNSTQRLMLYQFHLPRTEFTVVSDPVAGATAVYVFAPIGDRALIESGARLVWRDPRQPIGLWER